MSDDNNRDADAIRDGKAHILTMTRDEAENVWRCIWEGDEKAEELADMLDAAKGEGREGRSYVLIVIE
jgi:hypothetical protein